MKLPTFYGLFFADGTYKRNAYAFSLWSRIAEHPTMMDVTLKSTSANDTSGLSVIAGRDNAGRKALLLSNVSSASVKAVLEGLGGYLRLYVVSDASSSLQESTQSGMSINIPAYGVVLVTQEI